MRVNIKKIEIFLIGGVSFALVLVQSFFSLPFFLNAQAVTFELEARSLDQALQEDLGITYQEFIDQAEAGQAATQALKEIDFAYDDVWLEGDQAVISLPDLNHQTEAELLGFEVVIDQESPYESAPSGIEFQALSAFDDKLYRGGMAYRTTKNYFSGSYGICSLGLPSLFENEDHSISEGFYSAGHCIQPAGNNIFQMLRLNQPWVVNNNSWGSPIEGSQGIVKPGAQYGNSKDGSLLQTSGNADAWGNSTEIATWGGGLGSLDGPMVKVYDSSEPIQGLTVCKSGAKQGYVCGKIVNAGIDVLVSGNLVHTFENDICARPGDSGGSVFSGNFALGVTSGGTAGNETNPYCQPNEIMVAYPLDALGNNTNDLTHQFPNSWLQIYVGQPIVQAPEPNQVFSVSKPIFRGSVEAKVGATVSIELDDSKFFTTTDQAGNFSFQVPTELDKGVHSVTFWAEAAPENNLKRIQSSSQSVVQFEIEGSVVPEPAPIDPPGDEITVPPNDPVPSPGESSDYSTPPVLPGEPTFSLPTPPSDSFDPPASLVNPTPTVSDVSSNLATSTMIVLSSSIIMQIPQPTKTELAFKDLSSLSPSRVSAIAWLSKTGVTTGQGCVNGGGKDCRFYPDQEVKRGAMAQFLQRLAGVTDAQVETRYKTVNPIFVDISHLRGTDGGRQKTQGVSSDKSENPARYYAILWLADADITVGCSVKPTRFCPDKPVSRGSMAEFLQKFAGVSNSSTNTSAFPDVNVRNKSIKYDGDTSPTIVPALDQSRIGAINWLHSTGITAGSGKAQGRTTFRPQDIVTRGAMAEFMYKLAAKLSV